MPDLISILIILIFFAGCIGMINLIEKLRE